MISFNPSAPASSTSASRDVVFHCEYAPSGRAKCRGCLNSISEGSLRLAVSVPSAEPSLPDPENENLTRQRRIAAEAPQWCHANCFRRFRASGKWWRSHMHTAARWIGFSELSPADQAQVRRFVTACEKGEDPPHFSVDAEPKNPSDTAETRKHQHNSRSGDARLNNREGQEGSRSRKEERSQIQLKGKISRSPAGSGGKPRQKTQVTPQKEEDGSKPRSGRRQKGTSGKAESRPSPQKRMGGRKRKRTDDEAEKVAEGNAKHISCTQESAGEESIGVALTSRQQQDIEKQLEEAQKETVATLRSLLRMNNQKISGPKEELAHRVAECRVLGAVPKCPQCRMGFLRFDGNTREYRCPGFVNSEGEYERCPFKSTDVKRLPWRE